MLVKRFGHPAPEMHAHDATADLPMDPRFRGDDGMPNV